MNIEAGSLKTLFLLVALAAVTCGRADSIGNYPPPDKTNLVTLGSWAQSGPLQFRMMKVAETKVLETQTKREKAPRGTRFVIITLQVMPEETGKGSVDYVESIRILDAEGQGYRPNSNRFLEANAESLPVEIEIDAGTFVERIVPFLVNEKFTPVALRCTGSDDSEPCFIALRRKG